MLVSSNLASCSGFAYNMTAKLKNQKEYSSRKYERTAFATKDNDVMVFDSGQGIFRGGRFGDELSVLQTKEGAV